MGRTTIGGVIGAAAGGVYGYYTGDYSAVAYGWAIGSGAAAATATPPSIDGPRLSDLRFTGSQYGQPIPWVRGICRVSGQIVWASTKREVANTTEAGKGGGPSSTSYTYVMDILVLLADHECLGITRIWSNGKLVWTPTSGNGNNWTRLTIYTGAATQLPDPTYEAAVGTGNAPAYRGRFSCMIEGLALGTSGQLPNLTFEISRTTATGGVAFAEYIGFQGPKSPLSNVSPPTLNSSITSARSNWLSGVTVLGTNTFEGTGGAAGTANFNYTGGTATISNGSPQVVGILQSASSLGRYNLTTGLPPDPFTGTPDAGHWLQSASTGPWTFTYAFSTPISALSFFGTDFGDFDGTLTMVFRLGSTVVYTASPNWWVDAATAGNANLRFYGVRMGSTFDSVEFTITQPAAPAPVDILGFDQISVGNSSTTGLSTSGGTETIRAVVEAICARAGMPAGSYDASALDAITKPVRSLAVLAGASRGTLEQLASAFFFQVCLRDKLYFRPRGLGTAATIPWTDLAAKSDAPAEQSLPLTVGNDLELPPQVAVSYNNISDDSQAGTEYSDRMTGGQAAVQTVQLAIGMTPAEAKGIADAVVLDTAAALVSGAISLPMTYANLDPSDVVDIVDRDGRSYRMRLVRRRDERGVLGFEVVGDDATATQSQQITDGTQTPAGTVTRASATTFAALDLPLLTDADDGPGYYVQAKGSSVGLWPGGVVASSSDNTTFATVATLTTAAAFGSCSTTLGNFTGIGFDEVNALTVNVGLGTLSSSTRDAMLLDLSINAAAVGDEIIRFRTATLSSPGVYVLTGLLRGQKGTEGAIATHAAGETFALLTAASVRRVKQQAGEHLQLRYLRAGTLGQTLGATSINFTNSNRALRPLAPVDARATRQISGDVQITWKRRTRLSYRLTGPGGFSVPEDASPMAFEVALYGDSGRTRLVRTLTASASPATYTAAQLAADQAQYQDGVLYARIVQVGALGLRSGALDVALRPDLAPGATGPTAAINAAAMLLPYGGADMTAVAQAVVGGAQRRALLATTDAGLTWAATYSGVSAPAQLPGVDRMDAATSSLRLSIGFNFSAGANQDSTNSAITQATNAGQPTVRGLHPKVGGTGAFIYAYALWADSTTFYLVGRAETDANTGSGMYLYTCTDGATWALQGLLVQDGADPNPLSDQYAAFTGNLFSGLGTDGLSRRLQKIGSRWFLCSAFAVYYCDDSAGLTGWKRCPTGLGEGSTSPLPMLTTVLQFGALLVVARRNPAAGAVCISRSADSGATWSAERPGPLAASGYIAQAYVAHSKLVLQCGGTVLTTSALPGGWSSAATAGLTSPREFVAIGSRAACLDARGATYTICTSADSITWSDAAVTL